MLAARKTYLITARDRKNKRAARMLASARKDYTIPLVFILLVLESVILVVWCYQLRMIRQT